MRHFVGVVVVLVLTVAVVPSPVRAQTPEASDAAALADRAQRLVMPGPGQDLAAAAALLDTLAARHPGDARREAVGLLLRYADPADLLPMLQEQRQRRRARRLLDVDGARAAAHFTLGYAHYQAFDADYDAIALAGLAAEGLGSEAAALDRAMYALDAELVRSGRELTFTDRRRTGTAYPFVRKRGATEDAAAEGIAHLLEAVRLDPTWRPSYRYLMRFWARLQRFDDAEAVLATMAATWPDAPEPYLYQAYVAHEQGRVQDAAAAFDGALERMDPLRRLAFATPGGTFATPDDGAASFWQLHDERRLTPVNERRVEHMARMVYADLRFGDERVGLAGWETPPGEVVVRYGRPYAEARITTQTDAYYVAHFGEMEWRFMDLSKSGRWAFYSPPASAYAGATLPRGVQEHDYALQAPARFRERPGRSAAAASGDAPAVAVAAFRGEGGVADVVVSLDVPASAASGAFLLDRAGRLHAEARREGTSGAQGRGTVVHAVRAPAGSWVLSSEYRHGGAYGSAERQLRVPSFGAGGLTMSDVLLADGVEERAAGGDDGVWQRGAFAVRPSATGRFVRPQPVYLFFEIYNLTGEPTPAYAVEVRLQRERQTRGPRQWLRRLLGRGTPEAVAVRFDGTARHPEAGDYVVLDTADLDAGAYQLTVTITDAGTGRQVRRVRAIQFE